MIDRVCVTQPQKVLEVLHRILLQVALTQSAHGSQRQLLMLFLRRKLQSQHRRAANPTEVTFRRQAARGLEVGSRELLHPELLAMPKGIVHQCLLLSGAGVAAVERLGYQFLNESAAPRRPRYRFALQERLANGAGLLFLALQLKLAGFLRPLFLGRCRRCTGAGPTGLQAQ